MSNKKKILILADPLDQQNAGIHTYLEHLLDELYISSVHEYILIRSKRDTRYPKWRTIIIPFSQPKIPGWPSIRLFLIFPLLARYLGVDAVFEPAHFGPFFLPRHIQRITAIHDLTPILFPQFHTREGAGLQKKYLPSILQKTHVILSNSDATTHDLHKYLHQNNHSKIHTLPLGRDSFYQKVSGTCSAKKYAITLPFFLTVSTIEPRKNHLTILDAFAQFCEQNGTTHALVIAGSYGWKYEHIQEALKRHPYAAHIHMIGYIPKEDLRDLYNEAVLTIYASEYEGFGLPILESLACKTLCIAANNSSLPEVGGTMCQYFETGNSKELATHMITYQNHTYSAIEEKEIDQHITQFSWSHYAGEFEKVIT